MRLHLICAALLLIAGCKKKEEPAVHRPTTTTAEKPAEKAPEKQPEKPAAGEWIFHDLTPNAGLNVNPEKSASEPWITDAGDASPAVIWNERGEIYAKRWRGFGRVFDGKGTFEGLGAPLNHDITRAGSQPKLVIDGDDIPIAAWIEMNPDDKPELRVSRYVGQNWLPLGSVTADPKNSGPFLFDLTITAEGPVVAFAERVWRDQSQKIHVRRLDGEKWVPLGPEKQIALSPEHSVTEIVVAATTRSAPVVIWKERKSGQPPVVNVRRFTPQGWVALDSPAGYDGDTSLSGDAGFDGAVYLWMSKNVGFTGVQRLDPNGKSWTDLGLPPISGNPSGDFASAGGIAALSTDKAVLLFAHDGAWKLLGERPIQGRANVRAVAGVPKASAFVVWQDTSKEPYQIRVSAAVKHVPAEHPF